MLRCSARTGEGMPSSRRCCGEGPRCSSASPVWASRRSVNALSPGIDLRVGDMSPKHDRGNPHDQSSPCSCRWRRACASSTRRACASWSSPTSCPEEIGFHFREFAPLHAVVQLPALPARRRAAAARWPRRVERGESIPTATRATCGSCRSCARRGGSRAWMSTRSRCWSSRACWTSWPGSARARRARRSCARRSILTDREALDDLLGLALEFRAMIESGHPLPGIRLSRASSERRPAPRKGGPPARGRGAGRARAGGSSRRSR